MTGDLILNRDAVQDMQPVTFHQYEDFQMLEVTYSDQNNVTGDLKAFHNHNLIVFDVNYLAFLNLPTAGNTVEIATFTIPNQWKAIQYNLLGVLFDTAEVMKGYIVCYVDSNNKATISARITQNITHNRNHRVCVCPMGLWHY